MALKAGRVGVAPDQVDDFGKVKSEDKNWTSYSKKLKVDNVDLGTFELFINQYTKLFIAKFIGNSGEIPTGTHQVDFSDVLPSNVKPHGEWAGWLRGDSNVFQVHGNSKILALIITTAGSWFTGTITGIIDTGVA